MRERTSTKKPARAARVVCAAWIVLGVLAGAAGAADEPLGGECELGVALALNGERAHAESVFVSLLSHHPGDAAAFTNLGNLRLLDDDPEMALAFYRRAERADSTDAGIVLNEATALLLLGDDARAEARAREGLRMAGDVGAAASLMGLHYRDAGAGRGAERARLSQEEVLELLRAATGRVPADSVGASERPDSTLENTRRKRGPVWRSAGPRAGDLPAPALLYWKR